MDVGVDGAGDDVHIGGIQDATGAEAVADRGDMSPLNANVGQVRPRGDDDRASSYDEIQPRVP